MREKIFCALILCLTLSCTDNLSKMEQHKLDSDCSLKLVFTQGQTKVASQSPETQKCIRNVQVFVFRAASSPQEAVLDVCASAGFDTELNVTTGEYSGISLQCTAGQRVVYAIINDSQDRTHSSVSNISDLLAQWHELNNSTASKLLMTGSSDANLLPGENNLNISVRRMCASVVLSSVSNDFWAEAYRSENSFRLDAVYLLNVPGRINLGGDNTASSLDGQYWYNKLALDLSSYNLTWDKIGGESGSLVNYSGKYDTKHSLYTYPNDCATSTEPLWNPRSTVLVVEASIKYGTAWQKSYYPVVIAPSGGIQSNKQYKVDLTIHRPGSTDPNEPVQFGDVTPVIQVMDWETGESYNPEI